MSDNDKPWLDPPCCHRCEEHAAKHPFWLARMIWCGTCGNKRCPKATDHRLVCTGSNEPGQPGSVYR